MIFAITVNCRTEFSCCLSTVQAHHNGVNLVVAPGAVPPEQQRRAVLQTSNP